MKIKIAQSCLPCRSISEHILFDLERSISKSDLRSGPGKVMTQVGQYAFLPKRLDELSRLALFAHPYIHPVASYWRKTDCDHAILDDLSVTPDHRLYPNYHRLGEWS